MTSYLKKALKKFGLGKLVDPGQATKKHIRAFSENPDNTFLVSFPRTGSHWLRMLIELYFQRPTLVRSFHYYWKTNYLLLHTHDLDLTVTRENVIYLYRDPIDTIHSQLAYEKEDPTSIEQITYWSLRYGQHLSKWLCTESFTNRKTLLRYEKLKENLEKEYKKVCDHFESPFDQGTLLKISREVTKKRVSQKTKHDPQVINLTSNYSERREQFRQDYGDRIWEIIYGQHDALPQFFNYL